MNFEFTTFYHNALHLITTFYHNALHLTRLHWATYYQSALCHEQHESHRRAVLDAAHESL